MPPAKSSPIILDNRVFLTAHDGSGRVLLCLEARSGKTLWERRTRVSRTERRYPVNEPATPGPVAAKGEVSAFFPDFGLVSYTLDGRERWKVPLGPFSSQHGLSGSPVLAGGNVVLLIDQLRNSHIAAYRRSDGYLAWHSERANVFGGYTTPAVRRESGGEEHVIVSGPNELSAYDAATGKRIWWFRGVSSQPKAVPVLGLDTVYVNWQVTDLGNNTFDFADVIRSYDRNANATVELGEVEGAIRDLVEHVDSVTGHQDGKVDMAEFQKWARNIASSQGLFAIPLGQTGAVPADAVRWKQTKTLPDAPSPLLYKEVLYLFKNGGIVTALDAKSGELLKRGRLPEAVDIYYASPIAGNDKIYVASETGKVSVLKAGTDWQVLSTTDLGEQVYATPAISDGRVYVRTDTALYCFGDN